MEQSSQKKEKGIILKIHKLEALRQSSFKVKKDYTKAIQIQNHTKTNIKQMSVSDLEIMQYKTINGFISRNYAI